MKSRKYKGYIIVISVAVCYKGTQDIVAEFETVREACKEYSKWDYDFWYLASEVIDSDGNTNPSCWGRTSEEAIGKLKNVLK